MMAGVDHAPFFRGIKAITLDKSPPGSATTSAATHRAIQKRSGEPQEDGKSETSQKPHFRIFIAPVSA
jgi:hypothetical protein